MSETEGVILPQGDKTVSHKLDRRSAAWILGTWLITQTTMGLWLGIRMGGDSGRYIGAAEHLLSGLPLTQEQLHYLGYEALLVPIFALGGGVKTVAIVQCLFALAGAGGLFLLGAAICSRPVGLIAALLYLLHPSIQRWNFYLLTESLATNALVVTAALALTVQAGSAWGLLLWPAAVVLALSRPETALFLLPIILFLWKGKGSFPFWMGIGLSVFLVILGWVRPSMPSAFGVWRHWMEGTFIWGYPGIGPPRGMEPLDPVAQGFLWEGMKLFRDPAWLFKLVALRVFYFFSPTRPYFSRLHNAAAFLSTLFIYVLAIVGTFSGRLKGRLMLWSIIFVQGALAVLSWSDWDNRWLDRITPFLLLLASAGAVSLWNRLAVRRMDGCA